MLFIAIAVSMAYRKSLMEQLSSYPAGCCSHKSHFIECKEMKDGALWVGNVRSIVSCISR